MRAAGRRFGSILVSRAPGGPPSGIVRQAGGAVRAATGRAGIARTKREGDGRTPAGRFRPVAVLYRQDRVARPGTFLPVGVIRPDSGWCDDPADRHYNRAVSLPYPARHERLWRDDRLCDIVLVIDHNMAWPRPGAGSAIFFHLAAPGFEATAGCIALDRVAMLNLVSRMELGTVIDIR